jgi:ferric-dicitrate binding protein FerR (iron transport regulator)
MSEKLDAATIAYLAGDIDDGELAWLDAQLKENSEAARRFAQMCERDVMLASVLRMGARPAECREPIKRVARPRLTAWHVSAAIAATVVLLVGAWVLLSSKSESPAPPVIATVKSVAGVATLKRRNGSPENVVSGIALHAGDTLQASVQGGVTFAYADGTVVTVDGGSALALTPGPNKRVTLSCGALSAEVATQPADSPMQFITTQARADVVGTKLRVSLNDGTTRLDVTSGAVRLTRSADQQALLVKAGFFATAGADVAAPLTQRTIKSLRDDLPSNARTMLYVAFADRPVQWEGEFAVPPGNPEGAVAIGSHLFQPKTRFYGEIRSPHFGAGVPAGPTTYLRFHYRVDGFESSDLIKLMLKKKDGSIYHGFVRPERHGWATATLRFDGKFRDLENGAHALTANDILSDVVFLGAAEDGQQAQAGPRLWIDELSIFSTNDTLPVLNVEQ